MKFYQPKAAPLLSAQGSRGAYMPSGRGGTDLAQVAIGNTQNWAGAAAASSASKANVLRSQIEAPYALAQEGIRQTGENLRQITASAAGLLQQGSANQASLKIAKMRVDEEAASRRTRTIGSLLGAGVGIAGAAMENSRPLQPINVVMPAMPSFPTYTPVNPAS